MLKTNLQVAKFVIDLEEYLELLKYKEIVKKQEKQPSWENVLEFLPQPTFIKKVEFKKNFNFIPKVPSKAVSPLKTNNPCKNTVKTQHPVKEVIVEKNEAK
jgi:hypothetical protein